MPAQKLLSSADKFPWPNQALQKARRNTYGDPMYHSGRKKKEYASPYLEFLDNLQKASRKMPPPYQFSYDHAEGTRFTDWMEGEKILNDIIYECQQSLKEIEYAKLDHEAKMRAGRL